MTETSIILQAFASTNLADSIPHVGCGHYPKVPEDDYGQVNLELSDFGPSHSSLQFIFRDTGEMQLWATPNKINDYQMMLIFSARSEELTADLVGFVVNALPRISETVEVYRSENPREHYREVVAPWKEFDPEIHDPRPEWKQN
jgi:hypothetical protein